jgi:hypothetical protein
MTLLPFFLSLASPVSEAASFSTELSVERLAERSDRVIRGEVLDTRSEMADEGIFTVATIQVHETLMGPLGLITEVRVPGGSWNGIKLSVSGVPEFIVGEEMLLFLSEGRVTGLEQGAMLITGDYAWRTGRLGAFATPSNYREDVESLLKDPAAEIWHLDEIRIAID